MSIDIKNTETAQYIDAVKEALGTRVSRAAVITFGCQQNEADSERMRGMLSMMGYTVTDEPDIADVIIVNTCAIREHAEMKALSYIGRFKALKKKNPELIIGVCGCMAAQAHRATMLKNDFHYVTFTLEPSMLHRMPELIFKALTYKRRCFIYGSDDGDIREGIPHVRSSSHSAWVSVMYGCNNFCSYCIVPYVRGRERSRESAEIIAECRELIGRGYKEITLLGQNVNSYRADISFAELISRIAEIEGDFIIRFMTSHPKDVSDELIAAMGRYSGKVAPYFHLPLQSGSNGILKRMNRTYDTEKFLTTVKALREAVPSIALTSDVIVGFPGETETDFEDTLRVLREVRFDAVYSFIYSRRVGTRAADFDGQISPEVKDERMKRLLDMQTEISLEKNLHYVGKTVRVLVDSRSKRGEDSIYTARTPQNKLVHFASDIDVIGEFIYVKITSAGAFDLFGEISK